MPGTRASALSSATGFFLAAMTCLSPGIGAGAASGSRQRTAGSGAETVWMQSSSLRSAVTTPPSTLKEVTLLRTGQPRMAASRGPVCLA